MSRTLRNALALLFLSVLAHAEDWETYYEKSGKTRTPNYTQTVEYSRRLADASPWIEYTTYGTSPQGRPLPLLIVDRNGNFTPESVRASGNVVFMIQAGIHSGEISGKDAGLLLLRDIAIDKSDQSLLDRVTLLFLPIFNVDGHERMGPYNRINQNGPEEMGWRTTAQNLNLNRDYLKVDAPEMRAWIQLYRAWLPEFFADCHATDGADYQYPITHALEIYGGMDEGLTAWTRDRYLPYLKQHMKEAGNPTQRYIWMIRHHEPESGIRSWVAPPRFSTGYTSIQNRVGLLIETHMLKPYHVRVDATLDMLVGTIAFLNREADGLRDLCDAADRFAASPALREEPLPVAFELGPDSVMIDFLGFEYDVVESDLTGGLWHRFSDRKTTFRIPFFNTQHVLSAARLPEAYIIPPEWRDVIERVELHGVKTRRTGKPETLEYGTYRFKHVAWAEQPYEGRHQVTFEVEEITRTQTFPAGSVVIDMNQRTARLIANILEPSAADSYAFWGFFDRILERKEYVESYVIEEMAREMLARDPDLRREFEARKRSDEDFAGDPEAIRAWFYQRTPYYDEHFNLYPVGKLFDRATVDRITQ